MAPKINKNQETIQIELVSIPKTQYTYLYTFMILVSIPIIATIKTTLTETNVYLGTKTFIQWWRTFLFEQGPV